MVKSGPMPRLLFALIPFVLLTTGCNLLSSSPLATTKFTVSKNIIKFDQKLECTLRFLQEATRQNNIIEQEAPAIQSFGEAKLAFEFQKEGNVLIWMDFNGEKNKQGEELPPALGYIAANDDTKVVVINYSNESSFMHTRPFFTHTFFKADGTYVYNKINSISGSLPRATMSMGYCS